MTQPVPDDFAATETNDPSVHALWERDGATVRFILVRDEPESTTAWTLPS